MATKGRGPYPDTATHPGEHLAEFLEEKGMTQAELARRMGRHQPLVNMIVKGKKAITAETALQLEGILGLSAETWMNLQTNYDLTMARIARKKVRASGALRPRSRSTPA